jgi:hypothetical protein
MLGERETTARQTAKYSAITPFNHSDQSTTPPKTPDNHTFHHSEQKPKTVSGPKTEAMDDAGTICRSCDRSERIRQGWNWSENGIMGPVRRKASFFWAGRQPEREKESPGFYPPPSLHTLRYRYQVDASGNQNILIRRKKIDFKAILAILTYQPPTRREIAGISAYNHRVQINN